MKIIGIFFLIVILLISSCKETPTDPPEKEDAVPQTNIPWPSLANTPWPMHRHDPQLTGRSQYAGPSEGRLIKKVTAPSMESGISIGYNQTSYLSSDALNILYAMDYDGNIKWQIDGLDSHQVPLVSRDSTIYVACGNNVFAISQKGEILWNRNATVTGLSLAIDKDGYFYYINKEGLSVINKRGESQWQLEDDRLLGYFIVFSPDGKTLYTMGKNTSLVAIDITTKNIKWEFGHQSLCVSPIIDTDGNIIIVPSLNGICRQKEDVIMYSLNEGGSINWEYKFKNFMLPNNIEPTIDYNGNIYFGADTLYSLTNGGKLRWKNEVRNNFRVTSPLICDVNNVVYVGAINSITNENKVFSVDDDGTILWEILVTGERDLGVSPALTEDGTLLYPTWRGNNYLIIK